MFETKKRELITKENDIRAKEHELEESIITTQNQKVRFLSILY